MPWEQENLCTFPLKLQVIWGTGVSVQSTTRSPIYPAEHAGYAVQQAISFTSPDDSSLSIMFIIFLWVIMMKCLSS